MEFFVDNREHRVVLGHSATHCFIGEKLYVALSETSAEAGLGLFVLLRLLLFFRQHLLYQRSSQF